MATGRPLAFMVETLAGVLQTPGIHQRVARATVKTQHITGCWQNAQVGNTANIQYQRGLPGLAKNVLVKRRHEGSALATCGHVAAAKVCHHIHACAFGQQSRVVELQGVARCRLMPNGLAVSAYGLNVFGGQASVMPQCIDDFSVHLRQLIGSLRCTVQFVM